MSVGATRLRCTGDARSHQDARLQFALSQLHAAVDVPAFSVALESFLTEMTPDEIRILYPHIESAMRRLFEVRHQADLHVSSSGGASRTGQATVDALAQLTQAERELLHLVRQGWSNKEIAAELQKSIRTVKTQLTSVYKKLRVRTRARLMALYPQPSLMPAARFSRSVGITIE